MAEGIIPRGAIVTVVIPGDFGKPRPALVVQTELYSELSTILLCPLTSDLSGGALRIHMEPSAQNGLKVASDIMLDKVTSVRRSCIRDVIGTADAVLMEDVTRELALLIGLG
jgi:mRNA interferase MazF